MATPRILTLNAGSSSLKFALFEGGTSVRKVLFGNIERIGADVPDHGAALEAALAKLEPLGGLAGLFAVGHRIVHGGGSFESSMRVDSLVLAQLRRLEDLDPDHLPAEVSIVESVASRAPTLPQVACFDTAFHRDIPRVARLLPIPRRYEAEGMRRYGFHGLSYQFLLEELARIAGDEVARGRVVLAHLGSGASLAAVFQGRCLDTTMSYTPNSGVPMGTRSGDLDPGVVVRLLRAGGLDVDALDDLLSHRSGLLGVSDTSSDMRDLLARMPSDPRAADAVDLFCYSVRKAIGALAAVLGGIDTLVFAGGIGENAAVVRARVANGLEHLGIRVDAARNDVGAPIVSADGFPCVVRVIHTDEETIVARETIRVLDRHAKRAG